MLDFQQNVLSFVNLYIFNSARSRNDLVAEVAEAAQPRPVHRARHLYTIYYTRQTRPINPAIDDDVSTGAPGEILGYRECILPSYGK